MEFSNEFLEQFEPIGTLGEGGMAKVILANQKSLQRQVAIKFMAGAAFPASEAIERFKREAQMLAKLDHPNVLKIYDLGVEDDQPYLVLEYVRGETVRDRINREGPMKSDEAARVALMVARGLAYAHDKSILHRDVKPENVLLSVEGGVKLLDFGLGKLLEVSENISHGGVILGTPAYLAPELIMGNQPSESSDLYTIGVLLYEMLCGRTPFGDSAEPDKLLERTKIEIPTDPVDTYRPELRLREILIKTLRRSTEERYQQACEIVEALELYLGVSADPRIRRSLPGMTRPGSRGDHSKRTGPKSRPGRVQKLLRDMPLRPMVALLLFLGALAGALAVFIARPSRGLSDPGEVDVLSGLEGARVRWHSGDAYPGLVAASAQGLPDVVFREPQAVTEHDVLLTGLRHGRVYELKVGDGANPRYPPLKLTTAERLDIPSTPQLVPSSWDKATVTLELNVPAVVIAHATADELSVTGGERAETTQKLTISGPGAGVGNYALNLEVTTVEGFTERRMLPLRGAYDTLLDYVRSVTFGNDLESVDGAWKAKAAAPNPADAAIAVRQSIQACKSLKANEQGLHWLAQCLESPAVSFDRRARIYELLSEIERFNRIVPARIAHRKSGKVPLEPPGELVPLESSLDAFAESRNNPDPGDVQPVNPLYHPQTRYHPPIRARGQDVLEAKALLGDSPGDPKTAPDRLTFEQFMDNLPDTGRVTLSVKARCLSSALYLDVAINNAVRLRFFGIKQATGDTILDPTQMASEADFNAKVPLRLFSLTVPAKCFIRGKNAFTVTAGVIAPTMSSVNGPCLPVVHWIGWQSAR